MIINLNRMGFLKSLILVIKCGELKSVLADHKKGDSLIQEIKDDAFYNCLNAAEDRKEESE